MAKWLSILFLVAAACLAVSQDKTASATKESTQSNCELTQDDYAVFGALLRELGRPEHRPVYPEEAGNKEMLMAGVTLSPYPEQTNSGWGSRSKPGEAPSQETFNDSVEKAHAACIVQPEFGDPNSYRLIPRKELDSFFPKAGAGRWEAFYKKYPKSAGLWQFSRPGYNATRDEALVYVIHSCNSLCGTGQQYLLSKQSGKWTVKHRLMLWLS